MACYGDSFTFFTLLYLLYSDRSSRRQETSSQTIDIECVNHETNAPTNFGTNQKHEVHMPLSLHKSTSMQKIHPMYNKMHKILI
jgi:hypothetical protein